MRSSKTRSLLAVLALLVVAFPALAGDDTIYAVEGDVTKPIRTGGPLPHYPEFGHDEKIQGKVVVRVVIEKDGTIGDTEVVESLRDDFDAYTSETVSEWTFEPATLNGAPVRVRYNLTVNYRLDSGNEPDA